MAIIRSKIARQLLAEGGAPRKGFARGSGRGRTDADTMTGSGYTSSYDDGFGGGDEFATPTYSEQYAAMNVPDAVSKGGDNEPGFFQKGIDRLSSYTPLSLLNKFDQKFLKPGRDKYNLSRRTDFLRKQGLIGPGEEDEKYTDEFLTSPEGLDMLKGMGYTTIQDIIDKGRGEGGDSEIIKKLRAPITEKIEKPKGEFDDILQFYGARFAEGGRTDAESQYGADSYGSYSFEDDGNRGDGGGPPNPGGDGRTQEMIRPTFTPMMAAEKPGIMDRLAGIFSLGAEEDDSLAASKANALAAGRAISDKESPYGKSLTAISGGLPTDVPGMTKADAIKAAFDAIPKADGGEVRQNYGLGSIVKKVTGAVKKVAKSPLGKAALIGGLGFLGAKTPFGKNLLTDFKKLSAIKQAMTIGGIGLTAAPFFLGEEEEEEKLPTQAQSDPEFQNLLAFYGGPRRFAESGGDIEDAPMEMASAPAPAAEMNDALEDLARKYFKKPLKDLTPDQILELENVIEEMSKKQGIERTMAAGGGMMNPNDEMLDLGGNEMDLRGGGFVPLGEYEKKDDVPARLSKNEFVFTADAVKAAGGGSVDKGADVMYKTMKTLENKVA